MQQYDIQQCGTYKKMITSFNRVTKVKAGIQAGLALCSSFCVISL